MATVVTAVEKIPNIINDSFFMLFLAGGITGVEDWQSKIIKLLNEDDEDSFDTEIVLFNPRRKNFPINDPNAAKEQITWEYTHLQSSHAILFWFAKGTDNPIVLYELGKWGNSSGKPIFIGVEPGYSREQDVIIQTKLSRPDIKIHHSLEDLANEVKEYLNVIGD